MLGAWIEVVLQSSVDLAAPFDVNPTPSLTGPEMIMDSAPMLNCFVDMLRDLRYTSAFSSRCYNISIRGKTSDAHLRGIYQRNHHWLGRHYTTLFEYAPTLTLFEKSVVHLVSFIAHLSKAVDAVCY